MPYGVPNTEKKNNKGLVPEDLLPDPEMLPLLVPKIISKQFKK